MKRIVIALCLLAGLGSCQIYRTYQRPELPEVDSLFRQPVQGADTTSLADLTWRELFTDSRLQRLIDSGIMNNSDLQIARLRVAEARASLTASRLAYLPSLSLTPQGAVNAPEHAPATRTYDLAAAAEWEVDLFGKLLNEKRGAAAALAGQEAYRQAVETQLVATVANSYYTLLMLDRQLEITRSTSEVWAENVRVMEALKRAGQTTEMAVAQTVAEQASVEASVLALERQVLQTENALCVLLGTTPRTIDRSTLSGSPIRSQRASRCGWWTGARMCASVKRLWPRPIMRRIRPARHSIRRLRSVAPPDGPTPRERPSPIRGNGCSRPSAHSSNRSLHGAETERI